MSETCRICDDLGVIRVICTDELLDTLMLCDCAEGKNQRYKLPVWEWKCGQIFRREKCPIDWFKPESVAAGVNGELKLTETIKSKVEYWKAKVSIAEQYWAQAANQLRPQVTKTERLGPHHE